MPGARREKRGMKMREQEDSSISRKDERCDPSFTCSSCCCCSSLFFVTILLIFLPSITMRDRIERGEENKRRRRKRIMMKGERVLGTWRAIELSMLGQGGKRGWIWSDHDLLSTFFIKCITEAVSSFFSDNQMLIRRKKEGGWFGKGRKERKYQNWMEQATRDLFVLSDNQPEKHFNNSFVFPFQRLYKFCW